LAASTEIDRLLEEGLSLYGSGDLDGALVAWERVLALDPRHAQANSYVEYVRANYTVLSDGKPEAADDSNSAPFPVVEEPEYQIEIQPGELPPAIAGRAPSHMDPLDEGWLVEEETRDRTEQVAKRRASSQAERVNKELELETEEPTVEFETATREYAGGFANSENTPVGFAAQSTDVRKRELGFVQPTADPGIGVQVRIRTPSAAPPPPPAKPAPAMELGTPPPPLDSSGFELGGAGRGETMRDPPPPTTQLPFDSAPPSLDDDLFGGPSTRSTRDAIPEVLARRSTKDLPGQARLPADRTPRTTIDPSAVSQAEVVMAHAATRELGTRPSTRPPTNDDSPTREADVRAFREHHAAQQRAQAATESDTPSSPKAKTRPLDEGTRQDIVLPFDPIDARSAQILDEIDVDAPPGESDEDRTRRRLSTLFDRALAWNGISDYEKAVTAIDLALSEDPGSALAQKLIHRNRDTIMMVFQNYLGELDRQPQLAKPLHELATTPINPRAAFLLSRIDGTLSIDEILDVSGMPRMEAYRYLCQLFLRGVLK